MQLRFEIPDSFWSLFRSVNREVYIEALLQTFGEADERQERLETEDDMKEITGGTTIGEDTGVSGAL